MSKHTPGPWSVNTTAANPSIINEEGVSVTLVKGSDWGAPLDLDIEIANATLISAAPDLLAFARTMDAYFKRNPNGYEDLALECASVIAKAVGGIDE